MHYPARTVGGVTDAKEDLSIRHGEGNLEHRTLSRTTIMDFSSKETYSSMDTKRCDTMES
jgi:hypothetical protein